MRSGVRVHPRRLAMALFDTLAVKTPRPYNDTMKYMSEVSVWCDAPRDLKKFLKLRHGQSVKLAWPDNWVFTIWDVTRVGEIDVGKRILRDKYICCDRFLITVGLTHHEDLDPIRSRSVVLAGERGNVYVYERDEDAVYLVSSRGVYAMYEDGLTRHHGLREKFVDRGFVIQNDKLRYLFSKTTLVDLAAARDLMVGYRVILAYGDVSWGTATVCNVYSANCRSTAANDWAKKTASRQVELVMQVSTVCTETGAEACLLIVVDDCGRVFGVDRQDETVHYLAADVVTFFQVGLMRFRNNCRFTISCFSKPGGFRWPTAQPHVPRAECPRGLFCNRKARQTQAKP